MRTLICFLLLAALAAAADFSGKWTGTADVILPDGTGQQLAIVLQLRQAGGQLNGTIADASGNEGNIVNGAVEGNTITFEVQQGDNGPMWKVKLSGSGDQISGDANTTHAGQALKGRLSLKRSTS